MTTSHMAWHTERKGGRDLPSPILVNDVVVVISMTGIVSGYDAHDGQENSGRKGWAEIFPDRPCRRGARLRTLGEWRSPGDAAWQGLRTPGT